MESYENSIDDGAVDATFVEEFAKHREDGVGAEMDVDIDESRHIDLDLSPSDHHSIQELLDATDRFLNEQNGAKSSVSPSAADDANSATSIPHNDDDQVGSSMHCPLYHHQYHQ